MRELGYVHTNHAPREDSLIGLASARAKCSPEKRTGVINVKFVLDTKECL